MPLTRVECIDCEASGLGPESYPIEIGFAMSDGTTQSYLIKPEPSWTYWDQYAEDHIHKISRKMLDEKGLPAFEVANILNSQLDIVYSDALSHDLHWIDTLYDTVGTERKFEVRSIFSELDLHESSIWYDQRRKLFAQKGQHRAGLDAWVNQEAHVLAKDIQAKRVASMLDGD